MSLNLMVLLHSFVSKCMLHFQIPVPTKQTAGQMLDDILLSGLITAVHAAHMSIEDCMFQTCSWK
jgi:hypothetical protein